MIIFCIFVLNKKDYMKYILQKLADLLYEKIRENIDNESEFKKLYDIGCYLDFICINFNIYLD